MKKKRGYTLIELITTLAIVSILAGGITLSGHFYFKTKNDYEVKFAENSILAVISNAKQYCREKNESGFVLFDICANEIYFYSNGERKDYYKMPEKVKVVSIDSNSNKIDINNKGITNDASKIILRDSYGKPYFITICVGTFHVQINE